MKRYRGFEFRAGVESFAKKAAASLKLLDVCVHWKGGITTAGVNEYGDLYLADVRDDSILTHNDLLKYCGFVLHELCHLAYTKFTTLADKQYVRQLHNGIEDAFIEHRAIERALVPNVQDVFKALVNGMVAEAIKSVSDWDDYRQYPFSLAIYLRKHADQKVPVPTYLQPVFAEAAVRLESAQSTDDTLKIALWVFDQIKKVEDQKQEQKSKAGDGKPDGQDGDDSGGSAGFGEHSEAANVEPRLKPDYEGYGASYSKESALVGIDYFQRSSELPLSNTIPGKLRYNVKRLFDNTDRSDFQNNRKFGSINTGALANYKHSDNVFKLRREVAGIDSAVVICLDASASMFDDEPNEKRIATAVQCTSALLDTLRQAHVATFVVVFGKEMAVLKNWSDSVAKTRHQLSHIAMSGSTNDYQCIKYAHEVLLRRREARKVCIVLTDGDGRRDAVRRQIASGKNLGITTIGIGISLDVSAVYDQCINVKRCEDLGVATFNNIKIAA